MKIRLLSLMYFLTFTTFGISQSKLDGIGEIRLGMTFEQLNKFITSETRLLDKHYDVDDLSIIQIPRYEPIEGYYLKRMNLYFYKEQLYEIEINSNDGGDTNIDDALTIKYGEPQTKTTNEPLVFQNGFGATFTKTETTTKKEWKTNTPFIKCTYYHALSYTAVKEKILPYSSKSFNLVDTKIQEIVLNESEKKRNHRIQEENEKKKKLVENL